MPSIDFNFLSKLECNYKEYNCFIETGTYKGETIFEMEPYFDKLYTIEIAEHYYNETKNKYNGNKIDFLLGDSSYILQDLLPNINDNCVFFLDGHWSCDNTGRGLKDCPLIEEIDTINVLCKKNAVIVIDDFRLFGLCEKNGYPVDWGNITKEKIVDILKERITKVYHMDSGMAKDDRLIIHIRNN